MYVSTGTTATDLIYRRKLLLQLTSLTRQNEQKNLMKNFPIYFIIIICMKTTTPILPVKEL